jgi:hypothetical protein
LVLARLLFCGQSVGDDKGIVQKILGGDSNPIEETLVIGFQVPRGCSLPCRLCLSSRLPMRHPQRVAIRLGEVSAVGMDDQAVALPSQQGM